jgi:hypothetical protein
MKDFVDKYDNAGLKTNDGTLRVTKHFQTHGKKTDTVQYVRLENHNGKTVAIRIDKLPEVIEMLRKYSN